MLVPVVGNFSGPKALRAVGAYLKEKGAVVSAFYLSNVEMYLRRAGTWGDFCSNVATMPLDENSVFIRPSGSGFSSGTIVFRTNGAAGGATGRVERIADDVQHRRRSIGLRARSDVAGDEELQQRPAALALRLRSGLDYFTGTFTSRSRSSAIVIDGAAVERHFLARGREHDARPRAAAGGRTNRGALAAADDRADHGAGARADANLLGVLGLWSAGPDGSTLRRSDSGRPRPTS